ncbi:MAG: ATP-dependent Clp protease ATP-binding subunit [Pseudomonadota bacterium]
MITLAELRRVTLSIYPDKDADLRHMLLAWISKDPKGCLASLIPDFNENKESILKALNPYFLTSLKEDKEILMSCVLNAGGKSPTGWHLLSELGKYKSHPFSRVISENGFDPNILNKKIDQTENLMNQSLSEQGIDVAPQVNQMLKYGRNMTALARGGAFDDLCDRPKEIDCLLDILLRRKKGNIALTGPSGVGKTALIELFSRKIVHNEIFSMSIDTSVIEVSMGKLVAGTKYRGDFEQRMENVIDSFKSIQPAIMFIDEMHLIWGAGIAEGAQTDAANLLKPFLARGNLKVIGATTSAEYHRYIARDPALSRRFQEVGLKEPDNTMTFKIAKKQAASLIRHHNIQIPDTAIHNAIEMTNQHIINRYQPDKTLDLIDSAAVYTRRNGRNTVTEEDLYQTLSAQIKCPVSILNGNECPILLTLAERLKKRIIGQNQAVDKVVSTLIHRRQNIGSPRRNFGTFLFSGSTGVGKTELARSLAVEFFGNKNALLHLDLSEYSQGGSINNLIGSPRGYIGSQDEGVLVDWLHAQGGGVLLFDEVEKACLDVRNLLLGLLDNGRIRSARGEELDTRQSVIVLTTNAVLPSEMNPRKLGFNSVSNRIDPEKVLLNHFSPEFLARFDEILLFNTLGPIELKKIFRLRLQESLEHCRRKKINVIYNEKKLLDYFMQALTNNNKGARGIERLIEKKLLQPMAISLLKAKINGSKTVILDEIFYKNGFVTIQ